MLKRLKNVKIQQASEKIEDILSITKILLAPSVYPQAFGLIVTEAQLRGIPVVSTSSCGLAEANSVPRTQVGDVPIVYDPRAWSLLRKLFICANLSWRAHWNIIPLDPDPLFFLFV